MDADRSYAGFYHGWPVAYIDFAVNEGHATRYGGTVAIDYLYNPAAGRRVEAHAAMAVADGRRPQLRGVLSRLARGIHRFRGERRARHAVRRHGWDRLSLQSRRRTTRRSAR